MTSKCNAMREKLADLLLAPDEASAEARAHLEECPGCRAEIESLRAVVSALDVWEAPEPNAFFMNRFEARLREEKASRLGWLARLRAHFVLGNPAPVRPLAAMALTVLLLVGGGAYMSVTDLDHAATPRKGVQVVVTD